jgi:hypothetical protein
MKLQKYSSKKKFRDGCFYLLYIPNYSNSDHVIAQYTKGELFTEMEHRIEKDTIKKFAKIDVY